MKEVMKNKLSRIQDLDDRRLLKDILNYTFNELIDYCDSSYDKLVHTVYDQMEGEQKVHKIYTTICNVDEYDPIDQFMFPMRQEDLEQKNQMTDDILSALQEKGTAMIGRTFLQYDYLELCNLLAKDAKYPGKIVTESGSYPVEITLKKCDAYISCIEDLYFDYLANGMKWTSVNDPYIQKFVDFVITECADLPSGEEVMSVNVDLGDAEQYRFNHMIPLWNLEPVQLQSTNFPIPTQDNIHFQHKITLSEKNSSYDYIVRFGRANQYDGYCVRDSESVSIILNLDTIDYWPAYNVKEKEEGIIYDYPFPMISNGCHDNFMVRYVKNQGKVIRTKAELMRKLLSYEAAKQVKICEISFLEPEEDFLEETYSLNPFIEEDIRKGSDKKIMLVEYETAEQNYMARDIMSFLLSEVQSYFPEYKCEGRMR